MRRRGQVNPDGGYKAQNASCKDAVGAVLALFACAFTLLIGCGSTEAPSTSRRQDTFSLSPAPILGEVKARSDRESGLHLKTVAWAPGGVPHGHWLSIVTQHGYCVGDTPPRLTGVHMVENGRRVYVAASLEIARPSHTADCGGVGGFQRGIVRLGRKAEGARIFDASTSPATLRWPVGK